MLYMKDYFFMGGIRLNSEKKIENEYFKIKMGTTNKLNPIIIYVEGRAFITPLEELEDYGREISEIKHILKQSISSHLQSTDNFDNKYIVDFQIASNGIQLNKKSFLSFQFLMRQNKDKVLKLAEVKNTSSEMVLDIVNDLKDSIVEHGFLLSKSKK